MAYILDAVVILIFLLAVFVGYRRGFIKTISHVVALVAAVALAFLLSSPVAGGVYDHMLAPSIEKAVSSELSQYSMTSLNDGLNTVLETLPGFVRNALANQGVSTGAEMAAKLQLDSGFTAQDLAQQVVAKVVRPVCVSLLRVICFLVLFLILFIVASLLLRVVDKVFRLPGLRGLNKSLGLVAGILSGVFWVLLAVSAMQVVAASSAPDAALSQSVLESTAVVNWIMGFNPVGSALREIIGTVAK